MVRENGAGFGRRSSVRTMAIATLGHLVPARVTRVTRGLNPNLETRAVAFPPSPSQAIPALLQIKLHSRSQLLTQSPLGTII